MLEYTVSGLHLSVKGYNGFADHALQNKSIQCCRERTHTHTRTRLCVCVCHRKFHSGLVLPTTPCCENTHVCCSISQVRVTSKDQGLQLQESGRPRAAATIHLCAAEFVNSGLHPRMTGPRDTRVWPNRCSCEHTHACCRISKLAVAPKDTYVCFSINHFQVAPKDHRLHVVGRPTAAVSRHMRVAEFFNSGLHPKARDYKRLTDQVLL